MLVLSRKKNEQLILQLEDGREIIVTVTEIRSGRVRIGILAPRSILIRRLSPAGRNNDDAELSGATV
jgi:carbon storage regulator CsrA